MGRSGRWFLGHRDVGADPVETVQHGALGIRSPGGCSDDRDNQADPYSESHGDQDGLAHALSQLVSQVR